MITSISQLDPNGTYVIFQPFVEGDTLTTSIIPSLQMMLTEVFMD